MNFNSLIKNFLIASALGILGIVISSWTTTGYDGWQYHILPQNFQMGLLYSIPALVWGFVVSAILASSLVVQDSKFNHFIGGCVVSVFAGVTEEILYRWLLFLGCFFWLAFLNLITFGLFEWIIYTIVIPIANWTSFNFLNEWFYHEASWLIGSAIIMSNSAFRNGHTYQGSIGFINSWFLGLYFFYMALNHGLVTAIVVHILYDVMCFSGQAIMASTREYRPRKIS